MKYYEMHESVYRSLKDKNYVGWDRPQSAQKLWDEDQRISFLERFIPAFDGSTVLDLGTGAGNLALYCAKRGAHVIGVDLSVTAIEMAKKNASGLGLHADFRVADITRFSSDRTYDLIMDSCLLHCLIEAPDRKAFYEIVRKNLGSDGYFFISTMLESKDMKFDEKFFRFQDSILWSKGFPEIQRGRCMLDGESYFPHRLILTLGELMKETQNEGLEVVNSETHQQQGGPDNFMGLFALRT